jgi:hypothetical protein
MAEDVDTVDAVMRAMPEAWRTRWCGGERGPCGCLGCVQIGNRLIMTGLKASQIDPEHIDESKIPAEVFKIYKVTKEEWAEWMARNTLSSL